MCTPTQNPSDHAAELPRPRYQMAHASGCCPPLLQSTQVWYTRVFEVQYTDTSFNEPSPEILYASRPLLHRDTKTTPHQYTADSEVVKTYKEACDVEEDRVKWHSNKYPILHVPAFAVYHNDTDKMIIYIDADDVNGHYIHPRDPGDRFEYNPNSISWYKQKRVLTSDSLIYRNTVANWSSPDYDSDLQESSLAAYDRIRKWVHVTDNDFGPIKSYMDNVKKFNPELETILAKKAEKAELEAVLLSKKAEKAQLEAAILAKKTTLAEKAKSDGQMSVEYAKVLSLFHAKDLDWSDISDNIDQCGCDTDRIGVMIRWIDQQSYDDEWKVELPASVIDSALGAPPTKKVRKA